MELAGQKSPATNSDEQEPNIYSWKLPYACDRLSPRFIGPEDGTTPDSYSHPFSRASRAASMRFPAPNLLMAGERLRMRA